MSTFVQIVLNTIIAGGGYVLLSLGFNLLFKATKFFDVSYGALIAISAYCMFYTNRILRINILLSVLFSILFTIIIALLFNKFIYRTFRRKNTHSLIPLLASLGVYTSVVAIISLVFSSQFKSLSVGSSKVFVFLGGSFTLTHLVIIFFAIVSSFSIINILLKTRYGKALRAIDDDKHVAEIVGIKVESIVTKTVIASGFIAGIAGILLGFDTGIVPTMGLLYFLKAIIASIVGGIGSIEGGILGALILATIENLTVFFISAEWRDPVAFLVLIIILVIRPQGILKKI
jgi:branched-chain amino acid transport system permease protein